MLQSLAVRNYALIEDIRVQFDAGLSVITGETGAGKSILLDALGLLLGNRADLNALRNKEVKCVIEAVFNLSGLSLEHLFEELNFDYETLTIIRREILPGGKSRAFVNDSPVNLHELGKLGEKLIDIHSQHQSLEVGSAEFQFRLLDALAHNGENLKTYQQALAEYKKAEKELEELTAYQQKALREHEFNTFQLDELEKADLHPGMQETLEEKVETLSHVEEIQRQLAETLTLLENEEIGILNQLHLAKSLLQQAATHAKTFEPFFERLESSRIELADITHDLRLQLENLETDPETLSVAQTQLELLYRLQKKHAVGSVDELILLRDRLAEEVLKVLNLDEQLKKLENARDRAQQQLTTAADLLHQKRKEIIPALEQNVLQIIFQLGMPKARFKVELTPSDRFDSFGKDEVSFLFSANPGIDFGPLKKIASGGEISRVMLAIKSVLAEHTHLPTIIFDEIDTGVSGEVALRTADVLQTMGRRRQVLAITHLPQVAAKGKNHYKVFKTSENQKTTTQLVQLSEQERLVELAEMLGGKTLSEAALAHAKELMSEG